MALTRREIIARFSPGALTIINVLRLTKKKNFILFKQLMRLSRCGFDHTGVITTDPLADLRRIFTNLSLQDRSVKNMWNFKQDVFV